MQEILSANGFSTLYTKLQHLAETHSAVVKWKLTFENEITKSAALA